MLAAQSAGKMEVISSCLNISATEGMFRKNCFARKPAKGSNAVGPSCGKSCQSCRAAVAGEDLPLTATEPERGPIGEPGLAQQRRRTRDIALQRWVQSGSILGMGVDEGLEGGTLLLQYCRCCVDYFPGQNGVESRRWSKRANGSKQGITNWGQLCRLVPPLLEGPPSPAAPK